MRVTQNMMINSSIRWIQKQTEKLNDISTVVAAGKEVNKPSDDPAAAGQILEDRMTISKYAKYIATISETDTWIETANSTLDAIDSLLETAQDIIESKDSWDDESYLEQLESIYEQVVDLANTKLNSTYLYGGDKALTAPYADEVDVSGGTADSVVFALADSAATVTIEITDSAGNVVRTLTVSGGSEGTNTVTWDGRDDSGTLLADGIYDFTVSATDASGDAVAAYAAYRGDTGGKEVLIGENSTVTLKNDGSIFSGALSALSQAITALRNSSYTDDMASSLSDALESAMQKIKTEQVALSNVSSQLETADVRLDKLTLALENEINTIEVGDTTTAAVELEAQTTAREVTLKTVASVLKMSKLSDYV